MGIFNKQYQTSGAGISKNENKKTGASLFFEIFFRKFWNFIEVNMLFTLFFIPLIFGFVCLTSQHLSTTASLIAMGASSLLFAVIIGPANAGMTTVLRKYTLEKHSFILTDFLKSFKQNFKNAAIIGFADCIIVLSTISGVIMYPRIASIYGKIMYLFFAVVLAVAITVLIMNFYIFPMIIATDLSLKNIIKNAFALTCIALKKNTITLLLTVGIYAVFTILVLINLAFALLLPFIPVAFVSFIQCFNSYPIIQKYIINPYYENMGVTNPELGEGDIDDDDDEPIFEDKGGSEAPIDISGKEKKIEKRAKSKGKIIS